MINILRVIKNLLAYLVAAFGYKRPIFNQATDAAKMTGKPLLNAGCGSAYVELIDVNLDIALKKAPNFLSGDIQNLWMFHNKQFGAVYASHVLEHVEDPDTALRELHRVAEHVFVITPLPLWPSAWLEPDHKWLLWGTRKIARVPQFLRKGVNSMKHCARGYRVT